ncbi:MAG: DUF3500 domain-containing protein [Planctomycetaceae bacterium]
MSRHVTKSPVSRREFVQVLGAGAALATCGGNLMAGMFAGPTPSSAAETVVKEFYDSLSEAQRGKICFGFDHDLRKKINANWLITDLEIGSDFYSDKQRAMIGEIVKGLTSEDGFKTVELQTLDDNGGLDQYSVAVFGKPGDGDFEFELTGRHLTLRADGNSVEKAAFGGGIVYGHGEEGDPSKNLYFAQTRQANEVFQALDTDQRSAALLKKAPAEAAVQIQGDGGAFPGISVGDLKDDQKQLVEKTLAVLLAPYRQEDIDEVMQIVKDSGGVEKLHMAFYQQDDLQNDGTWDIWRVEGPAFVWHFRGAPHVHAYINIGQAKAV